MVRPILNSKEKNKPQLHEIESPFQFDLEGFDKIIQISFDDDQKMKVKFSCFMIET